jgi:hypothetical protein
MSDFSSWFCRRCRQPVYACNCEDPDFIAPMIDYVIRGEVPPHDHPWLDSGADKMPNPQHELTDELYLEDELDRTEERARMIREARETENE